MPPGLHHAALDEAVASGIPLSLGTPVPWLTGRGHLADAVRDAPSDALSALTTIHRELDGDTNVLANKRAGNPPTPDLIHDELGCLIEVDEKQHFTSARLRTFEYYPPDCELGFDNVEYRALVEQWRTRGDSSFAHKFAPDFPRPGGRQAQRAYNDALRDLLAPTFTGHPLIRLAVPDRSLEGILDRLRIALANLRSGTATAK